MVARIYRPARSAMQSGKGKSKSWLLEFEPDVPRTADPLMGWTSSGDTRQQLRLGFDTKELAIAYATKNGIAYVVAPNRRCGCRASPIPIISNGAGPTTGPTE